MFILGQSAIAMKASSPKVWSLLPAAFLVLAGGLVTFTSSAQNRASSVNGHEAALDVQDFDPTCKPCDDFYQFATGGWRKRHPIGPAYASWARFSELAEKNQDA